MIVIEPRDLAALCAGVRAAVGPVVLVKVRPDLDSVEQAAMLAALGPLALERAPDTRVNALVVDADGSSDAVEAASRYLEAALATTGQVLRVSG